MAGVEQAGDGDALRLGRIADLDETDIGDVIDAALEHRLDLIGEGGCARHRADRLEFLTNLNLSCPPHVLDPLRDSPRCRWRKLYLGVGKGRLNGGSSRCQGSIVARSWPSLTVSASATSSRAMRPPTGASTGISIFIDSRIKMGSPSPTVPPAGTSIF